MKRSLLLKAVAAIVALGAAVAVALAAGWLRPRPLVVAAILPLGGPDAAVGRGMRNAIRLAVDEVNARGGVQGRKVRLLELDEASNSLTAAEVGKRVATDDKVLATIGYYDKDVALAADHDLRSAGIPALFAGVSTRDKGDLGTPTDFGLLPLGGAQMTLAARHAWQTLGARTFVFVHDGSDFGISRTSEVRTALASMTDQPIASELIVRPDDNAFRAVLDGVAAHPPQYAFFAGRSEQAAAFVKALRAGGFKGWFQCETHYPDPDFVAAAGASAEGALTVFAGLPPDRTDGGRAFASAYAARNFAEPAGPYGVFAYAGAQALLGAMEKSFLTRPSLVGALSHEKIATAVGPLGFHYMGSTYQTMALYQVANGRWVPTSDKSPAH